MQPTHSLESAGLVNHPARDARVRRMRARLHAISRWMIAGTLLLSTAGCATGLATLMYVIDGTNVKAEYDGLIDRRVLVACRPASTLSHRSGRPARELTAEIARMLGENVRKIEIIDPDEVEEWIDTHGLAEYEELGKALDADLVVGIDLDAFSLYGGQTIYQGQSLWSLSVFDMQAGGDVVYELLDREVKWPPNSPTWRTSDTSEAQFRREFVTELAQNIARHFYDHDSRVDFARDSMASR